jgi:hypothetical protein
MDDKGHERLRDDIREGMAGPGELLDEVTTEDIVARARERVRKEQEETSD